MSIGVAPDGGAFNDYPLHLYRVPDVKGNDLKEFEKLKPNSALLEFSDRTFFY